MYYELVYYTGLNDKDGGYTSIPCYIDNDTVQAMLGDKRPAFIEVFLSDETLMVINTKHINILRGIQGLENPQGGDNHDN